MPSVPAPGREHEDATGTNEGVSKVRHSHRLSETLGIGCCALAEQPIHIPDGRPFVGLAGVEAVAEDPIAGAPVVLEAIIIARARSGRPLISAGCARQRPPPFGGKALRSGRLRHAMADAP